MADGFARWRQPTLIFGVLAAGLVIVFAMLVAWQTKMLTHEKREELQSILALKADALEVWLAHNREDARVSAVDLSLRREATAARAEPSPALKERLDTLRRSIRAAALLVLDTRGRKLGAAGETGELDVSPGLRSAAAEVARQGTARWNYIHRADKAPGAPVLLDFLVPLRAWPDAAKVVAVLVLRRNASDYFFPLIQQWPSPSRTAETLLVRRRGSEVEYLNDLRFSEHAALRLRMPLNDSSLPAARAVAAGKPMIMEGRDYHGVKVLAVAQPVRHTDWILLSEIDADEALAGAYRAAGAWFAAILGLVALAMLGVSVLGRQGRRIAAERARRLETQRAALSQRFELLSQYSNDIVLLTDERNRVVEANNRAVERYGIPRERLLGMPLPQLRAPPYRAAYASDFERIMRDGGAHYETVHVAADGREFPVEISAHRVTSGGVHYVQSIIRDITERKRVETALQDSNRRLLGIIERLPFGMICASHEGRVAELINEGFTEITGYSMQEAGTFEDAIEHLMPDPQQRAAAVATMSEMVAEAKRTGRPSGVRLQHFVHRDGPLREVEVQFVDLGSLGIWTFRDVTDRVLADQRIERLSMLKDALSAINRAIVRVSTEEELFEDACSVAVERAGCMGAWIGLVDRDTRQLHPVAAAGVVAAGMQELELAHGDGPEAARMSLSHAAMAGDCAVVSDDFLTSASAAAWQDVAARYGIGSAAAFPLRSYGVLRAVLSVYHAQADPYDEETVALFEEMAEDISFALEAIRSERERGLAERSLLESEERFRAIVEQTISGIYIINRELRFIYVNPRLADIFGYASNAEINGRSVMDLVEPEHRSVVAENLRRRFTGEVQTVRYDFGGVRKDGTRITLGAHGTVGVFQGEHVVVGVLQDVTEVRRAEEEARRYVERLERTTESTIEIISVMGELRDPYTRGHERRVGELAAAIGAEMGLDEATVEGLRVIGHLHDVGKIGIPAEILAKPSRLSQAEYELVKEHPQQGYEILKGYAFPWPVAQAVLQHHERLDGSGYPQGLQGDQLMLEARILAVADTVEAMSSHRPYRPGLGLQAALAQIEKGVGTLYDPDVAAACLRLFREKAYEIPQWRGQDPRRGGAVARPPLGVVGQD